MSSPRDWQARNSEIPIDVEPFDPDIKDKARVIVYEHSQDLQECAEFWKMLGIHPDQEIPDMVTEPPRHPIMTNPQPLGRSTKPRY